MSYAQQFAQYGDDYAAQVYAQEQAFYDGEFAKLDAAQLAFELQAVDNEIAGLPYLSFRYPIADMRRELQRKRGYIQAEIERRAAL